MQPPAQPGFGRAFSGLFLDISWGKLAMAQGAGNIVTEWRFKFVANKLSDPRERRIVMEDRAAANPFRSIAARHGRNRGSSSVRWPQDFERRVPGCFEGRQSVKSALHPLERVQKVKALESLPAMLALWCPMRLREPRCKHKD